MFRGRDVLKINDFKDLFEAIKDVDTAEAKKISFDLYTSISDVFVEKEKNTYLKKLNNGSLREIDGVICDNISTSTKREIIKSRNCITVGMLHKLMESPVFILLKEDTLAMMNFLAEKDNLVDKYQLYKRMHNVTKAPVFNMVVIVFTFNHHSVSICSKRMKLNHLGCSRIQTEEIQDQKLTKILDLLM